jgi:hypothetical protein
VQHSLPNPNRSVCPRGRYLVAAWAKGRIGYVSTLVRKYRGDIQTAKRFSRTCIYFDRLAILARVYR